MVFSFWPSVKQKKGRKRKEAKQQRRPPPHHAAAAIAAAIPAAAAVVFSSRLHHTRCEELKDIRTLSASSSFSSWPLFRGLFGFFSPHAA